MTKLIVPFAYLCMSLSIWFFVMMTIIGTDSIGSSSNSVEYAGDCNEAVCASIVSKCILTQACKCNNLRTNQTCNSECKICLDYLYQDCCLCVDLCDAQKETSDDIQSRSNVEYIKEPQTDLFNLLTEFPDQLERWKSFSFGVKLVAFDTLDNLPSESLHTNGTKHSDQDFNPEQSSNNPMEVNCTVSFMSQCMSFNKCKSSCASMGASAYRWFHDGCCECVGQYCPEFGLSKSKCSQCPMVVEGDRKSNEDGDDDSDSMKKDKENLFPSSSL